MVLLLWLALVAGLAWCVPSTETAVPLDLSWLTGDWQSSQLRLTWKQATPQGMAGLFQDSNGFSLWVIERGTGHCSLQFKEFGSGPAAAISERAFRLEEYGLYQARFVSMDRGFPRILDLQYQPNRTRPGVLRIDLLGAGPNSQPQQTIQLQRRDSGRIGSSLIWPAHEVQLP